MHNLQPCKPITDATLRWGDQGFSSVRIFVSVSSIRAWRRSSSHFAYTYPVQDSRSVLLCLPPGVPGSTPAHQRTLPSHLARESGRASNATVFQVQPRTTEHVSAVEPGNCSCQCCYGGAPGRRCYALYASLLASPQRLTEYSMAARTREMCAASQRTPRCSSALVRGRMLRGWQALRRV